MPEPLALPSYDDLDELVDTDPIRLRNKAWELRCEAARLAEDLKRATEVVEAVRQVTGGGYLPSAWSYKWRERAETAESRIAEALDLASRLDPTSGHGRVRAFIADLRRVLGEAVSG
jgi:hypothetical protein